jgi:isoquinoline 1-oxidoreductase beta subunit
LPLALHKLNALLPNSDADAAKDLLANQQASAPMHLRVGRDNTAVTVLLAHSEMGQSIWTTLPMLIAEDRCELGNYPSRACARQPIYAHTAHGLQIIGGSTHYVVRALTAIAKQVRPRAPLTSAAKTQRRCCTLTTEKRLCIA